jgi:8-oxo-dGTP pyrophosphatase MutT (NUDIX family)
VSGYRRPDEVVVVVRRQGADGAEYLVLLRSPDKLGYWHLVAGGVEWGEEPDVAAARELREETGLDAPVRALALGLSYALADDPESLHERFPPGTERIRLHLYVAEAPTGWEPALDAEHVDLRWLGAAAAAELLHYPEPREAVLAADREVRA